MMKWHAPALVAVAAVLVAVAPCRTAFSATEYFVDVNMADDSGDGYPTAGAYQVPDWTFEERPPLVITIR